MVLQREGSQPLYLQIARHLEQDIAKGRFPPYTRLLSESALMRRFEVSRVTVRAAIARLAHKGLVDVHQGKGTFVAGPVIRHGLDDYAGIHDALLAQGLRPDRRLLEFRRATVDERAGTPFSTTAAAPMLLKRLYVLHGKPCAVIRGLVAAELASLTRREATAHTIADLLRNHGNVSHAEIAIRSRQADGDIGPLLGVPRRQAVLQLERTSYATNGSVLDFSVTYIVPEAWEFRLTLSGSTATNDGLRRGAGHAVAAVPASLP